MTFFQYLDLHPILSGVWFALICLAIFVLPVMIVSACLDIKSGRSHAQRVQVYPAREYGDYSR